MNLVFLLLLGIVTLHTFWFVTDPRPLPQRIKEYYGKRTAEVLLIEAVALLPQIWSGLYAPLPAMTFDSTLVNIGILIYLLGVSISVWGKITMNKLWGPPGEHDFSRQKELITSGAFTISRTQFTQVYF